MHKTHKQNIMYLNSDYVLYIASKQLRDYGYCFAIIDLKARHIVSHFYKATPLDLSDMIDCLSSVIKETSFLPNVKFINSNPASLKQYSAFDKLDVKCATGPLNQIVQRTFRTLTNILKNQLQDNIETALHEAIKIYNNKPHKALHGMTPKEMIKLLFPSPLENQLLFPIEKESCNIKEYRLQVIEDYAGDWQQFFINFRNDTNNKFNEILTQNKMLYEQNIELQKNSTFMKEEIVIMRKQRLESEQRKQKKQNAKKQELRASITPDEFNFILGKMQRICTS